MGAERLDEFLDAFDRDNNEWWRRDDGDLLNLFEALREDRDGWRDQVVVIRKQQLAALREAEGARAALRNARDFCARPEGVCLPVEGKP